jgi:hypothetical protein
MDAEGVQILERAIAAAGGHELWQKANSFRAFGALSLYSGGIVMDTGSVSIIASGLKKFRLEAKLEHETRRWLWKDGQGTLSTGYGSPEPIGRHNLAVLEGITLPVQRVLALTSGKSHSVSLTGSRTIEGKEVLCVRVVKIASDHKEAALQGRPQIGIDILIDPETFAIVAVEDSIYPNTQTRDVFAHQVIYGDYRSVSGMQVPFSVREQISGQLTWGLQLESFELDENIADSEFSVK